jgi:hypothetical protein
VPPVDPTEIASGSADFTWAAIYQKARPPFAPRKMVAEKCYAERLQWEAILALSASGLAGGAAPTGAASAADYQVRLENTPSGITATIATTR